MKDASVLGDPSFCFALELQLPNSFVSDVSAVVMARFSSRTLGVDCGNLVCATGAVGVRLVFSTCPCQHCAEVSLERLHAP